MTNVLACRNGEKSFDLRQVHQIAYSENEQQHSAKTFRKLGGMKLAGMVAMTGESFEAESSGTIQFAK